jgi:hypothetical protein
MDGRAARERRTSWFYAELGANLCEQVFKLVHFSFETRDIGLHAASSEMSPRATIQLFALVSIRLSF